MLTGAMSSHAKDHQIQDSARSNPIPQAESLLISVEETAAILNLGRTSVNRLIGHGIIKSVKIGRRRLVVRSELPGFVESLLGDRIASEADLGCERDSCGCNCRPTERREERGITS
jgi:excisionase family DNA binding protein